MSSTSRTLPDAPEYRNILHNETSNPACRWRLRSFAREQCFALC